MSDDETDEDFDDDFDDLSDSDRLEGAEIKSDSDNETKGNALLLLKKCI